MLAISHSHKGCKGEARRQGRGPGETMWPALRESRVGDAGTDSSLDSRVVSLEVHGATGRFGVEGVSASTGLNTYTSPW